MSWPANAAVNRGSATLNSSRNLSTNAGSPFCAPAVNSNPNFRPTRIGVSMPSDGILRVPKPPEKPIMPYMRYSRRMWERVRAANPESKFWDIGKIIGKMWRELSEGDKQVYFDEYEVEKAEYDKQMKAYHNSAAFQTYLAHKPKDKHDSHNSSPYCEQGVYIQPLDEESEELDPNNYRYMSSERFARNQRLIAEILSNVAIPDLRSVITTERINVLRSQVTSLSQHQATLENELRQLEETCEMRKRRIDESHATFEKRMKEMMENKPVLTEELFRELCEQWTKKFIDAYEKRKKRQERPPDVKNIVQEPDSEVRLENQASTAEENGGSVGEKDSVDENLTIPSDSSRRQPVPDSGDSAASHSSSNADDSEVGPTANGRPQQTAKLAEEGEEGNFASDETPAALGCDNEVPASPHDIIDEHCPVEQHSGEAEKADSPENEKLAREPTTDETSEKTENDSA
ncbi:HMG box [Trichuris suis]|nr:HMG box [Trichuris suis]